jgi:hypothetical protein
VKNDGLADADLDEDADLEGDTELAPTVTAAATTVTPAHAQVARTGGRVGVAGVR